MIRNRSWTTLLVVLCAGLCCGAKAAMATPQTAEPFKLGGLFSLTGFGQRAGESTLHGAQLAVEEINLRGGIAGHPVELVVEDFRSDLKATAAAMQKLATIDKVAAVVGPNWTEFSEVAAGVANRSSVVMVTPSGYTKTLTKDRSFVFSALESHGSITAPLSAYISAHRPKRLAALVMQNTFHQSILEAMTEQLRASGVAVWQDFEITPGNQDFRSIIARLKAEEVDAVLMLLLEDGTDFAFLKQAKELGFRGAVYSGNSVVYDEAFAAEPAVAEGVVFFDYNLIHTPEFESRYRGRFKTEPMPDSGRTYDIVFAIKAAAEKCGLRSEEIRKCLLELRHVGVSGPISFDQDRNLRITRPVSKVYRMQSGSKQVIE